jgi:hypothetical protein
VGSPALVNEVLENILTLTGNQPMQTPNKNKLRAVILSDSHLKVCTKRINNYLNLSNKFRTFGWIKPGTFAEQILDRLTVDLVNFKKHEVIVISAGANVYRNNPNEALRNIIKFIQNNSNTNIMILGIPHRHDLVEYKLKKVANSFKHVTIMECNYNREYFTIWNLSATEEMPPISLGWKTIQEQIVSSCALVLEAGKAEGG